VSGCPDKPVSMFGSRFSSRDTRPCVFKAFHVRRSPFFHKNLVLARPKWPYSGNNIEQVQCGTSVPAWLEVRSWGPYFSIEALHLYRVFFWLPETWRE
jgi:hypothetical protein